MKDYQLFLFVLLPLAMIFVAAILVAVRKLTGGQVGLYVVTLIAGAVFLATTGRLASP